MRWILSTALVGLVAIADLTAARESMGKRAQTVRQKRADMANSHLSRQSYGQPSSNSSSYRYLTNSTQPYLVESLPDVTDDPGELYSGTIPVDLDDPEDKNFFWVWQPKVGGDPVDEVTVWFNGGPGCSSLEAFLQENGKFIWSWGMYNAEVNMYSWVNLTNVLWVEYPIGLGFSTGNVTATSEEETAADFLSFFKNFQDTFGIENYKIYVTGESYAGRYVPYVSAALLDQNDTKNYDLSGALMYDPVIGQYEYIGQTVPTVPYVQKNIELFNLNKTFMSDLAYAHEYCGYANLTNTYLQFPPPGHQPPLEGAYNNKTFTAPSSNQTMSCDVWDAVIQAAAQVNPCFNVYEISSTCPILSDPLGYPTILEYLYSGFDGQVYFNRTDVKEAIHAPSSVDWLECSGPVFVGDSGPYSNGDLSADPIQSILPKVIQATNRVLVANGDYDFELLTEGTLMSIQNMTWGESLGFQSQPSKPIIIELADLQYEANFVESGVEGYDGPGQGTMGVQHFERGLMWAETYQSGHMQPQFQARSSYRHLQWLLGRVEEL